MTEEEIRSEVIRSCYRNGYSEGDEGEIEMIEFIVDKVFELQKKQ